MTRSLRSRLQWWYGSILTIALICFGSLVYLRAQQDMQERALRQSLATLEDLAAGLRAAHPRPPREQLSSRPRDVQTTEAAGQPLPAELLFPLPPPPPPVAPSANDAHHHEGDGPTRESGPRESNGGPPRGRPPRPGEGGLRFGPPPPVGTRPRPARRGPPDRLEFVVWNADGSRLMQSRGPAAEQLSALERPTAFPEPRFRQTDDALQVFQLGPRETVLLVHRTVSDDRAGLHLFGGMIAVVGGLTIVTAVLGGHWIAGRMVRPINRIADTAATISAVRLDQRIETAGLETELIPLAGVLNQTFERLQHSFAQLTQFTADASHELRTPLAVIQAQAELALLQPRTTEQYQDTVKTCLQSAERMRGLVDALLLLARGDAQQLRLTLARIDLRDVAGEACAQLQTKADTAGVRLICDLPQQPVRLQGDAPLLGQIAANLLSNGIQHTPRGGTVRILITADNAPQMQVSDSGCGIAAEHLPRIFDRFYRVDESRGRRQGGNGLGLAICSRLAALHGATIRCQSAPGEGSVFTVEFPVTAESDQQACEQREQIS